MSKVWSQLAQSKSIAANFNAKWVISQHQIFWYITDKYTSIRDWQTHLVVHLSTFADQDVLKVISDSQEKESSRRKGLEAKRAAARAAEAEAAKANAVKTESAAEGDGEETADEPAASEDGDEVEEDEEYEEEGSGADPGAGGDADPEAGGDAPPEAGDVDANKEEAGPIHIGVFCDGCRVSVPTNTR
jgi:hypothetical protein